MIGIMSMFIHDIKPLSEELDRSLNSDRFWRKTFIQVEDESEPWLIKVHTKRCRLCGEVLTPSIQECDLWYEGYDD